MARWLDPEAPGEPAVEGCYIETAENNFLTFNNINSIYFQSRINCWFQAPGIIETMNFIRSNKPAGHKYITYGSSMGGHAAISFFHEIGADFFLALSPQVSMSDAYMDSIDDNRWRKVSRIFQYDHILEGKCKNARGIVTTDLLYPEDRHHALDLIKNTTSYLIDCPEMWHESGRAVNREYGLVELLKTIGQNELQSVDSFIVAAEIQKSIEQSDATKLVKAEPWQRLEIIAQTGLTDIDKQVSFDALAYEFKQTPTWERAIFLLLFARSSDNQARLDRLSFMLKNNGFENLAEECTSIAAVQS